MFADLEGNIRLWNQGAERMFGYSAGEALGQSLDLIIPEKLRERHWAGYHATMASGATRYADQLLAVPALHRSGTRLSIEFSVVLLTGEDGRPCGVAAIVRDVTERRQKERTLHERLAAMEGAQQQ
jgi:PAS domain S-box-containing protein